MKPLNDIIAELRRAGFQRKEIAKKAGCTINVVDKRLRAMRDAGILNLVKPCRRHTKDMIERVRRLIVDQGMSSNEASDKLGLSRNAVIGIRSRNGMCKKKMATTVTQRGGFKRWAAAGQHAPVHGGGKEMMVLAPRDCRWPVGDPGGPGFAFCGAKAELGYPYCAAHCLLAYKSMEAA